MNTKYSNIIRCMTQEEKIAGYVSICETIKRVHKENALSCKTCLLDKLGCTKLANIDNVIERAELVALWEEENPEPVWSYKDEFLSRAPDAELDKAGYPTCKRKSIFKDAAKYESKPFSAEEEWDAPYYDPSKTEETPLTPPQEFIQKYATQNAEETLAAAQMLRPVKHNLKNTEALQKYLTKRCLEYLPVPARPYTATHLRFCTQSVRKVIKMRWGASTPSGTVQMGKEEIETYANLIDEILPKRLK